MSLHEGVSSTISISMHGTMATDITKNALVPMFGSIPTRVEAHEIDSRRMEGWVIVSTWIHAGASDMVIEPVIRNVVFRLARGTERVVLMADIPIPAVADVVENIDSDEPGSEPAIISGLRTEIGKTRAAAIAGFGPFARPGPGMDEAMTCPPLRILGLDIEVSTHKRMGGMPLPHDEIISICITDGSAVMPEVKPTTRYAIHTMGTVNSSAAWVHETGATIVKARDSTEAVAMAFKIISEADPDFVVVHNGFSFDLRHMAAVSAPVGWLAETFEERRLGNVGTGIFWRLPNGIMVVDSMYFLDKTQRKDWESLTLANIAKVLGLDDKMDAPDFNIAPTSMVDVTDLLMYNARDADLHVGVAMKTMMCERIAMLAGCSRSTIWDSVANNTGVMTFCVMSSTAISKGRFMDISRRTDISDFDSFQGGEVIDPVKGVHSGVVMIDGNSLYGTVMCELNIFVNTCASSPDPIEALRKVGVDMHAQEMAEAVEAMETDSMVFNDDIIVMRSDTKFIAIKRKEENMLRDIIKGVIKLRSVAKAKSDEAMQWAFKIIVVSFYGAMGSRHGILSAMNCAEATTTGARIYLNKMARTTTAKGYRVIYGDTDSIFVTTGAGTKEECTTIGMEIVKAIEAGVVGTPYAGVTAEIKGVYEKVIISAKKKYCTMAFGGAIEVKGMGPVRKDALMIAKVTALVAMRIVMKSSTSAQAVMGLARLFGKVVDRIKAGEVAEHQMTEERKIMHQPHHVYRSKRGCFVAVAAGHRIDKRDIDIMWVMRRVEGAVASVLEACDFPGFAALLETEMIERAIKSMRVAQTSASPTR